MAGKPGKWKRKPIAGTKGSKAHDEQDEEYMDSSSKKNFFGAYE